MDTDPTTAFPVFKDGDVMIVLSPLKTYKLHSSVLKRNSTLFSREIGAKPPPRLSLHARNSNLAPYHFQLVGGENHRVGSFVRKVRLDHKKATLHLMNLATNIFILQEVYENGRVAGNEFKFYDIDQARLDHDKFVYWDWLFGTFYHRPPAFDDTNLATTLQGCMSLIDVAESVGSIDQVREVIDLALLRQDKVLWLSIANNPLAWADLGNRVHSPVIFKEAVIHIVGRWNSFSEEEKRVMRPDVYSLCEKKFKYLDLAKMAIEVRILGHYPSFLQRTVEERPGRPSYANDIYMWMAVCFFRHWFTQAVIHDHSRRAADGGFKFYGAIAKAGPAYLHHEDFQSFHQYFPMSSKACHVLESNMGVLKEDIKQFVKDLVLNRSHIDVGEAGITWLTSTKVDKEDYPWYIRTEAEDEDVDGTDFDENEQDLSIDPFADVGGQKNSHGYDTDDADDEEDLSN